MTVAAASEMKNLAEDRNNGVLYFRVDLKRKLELAQGFRGIIVSFVKGMYAPVFLRLLPLSFRHLGG